MSDDASLRVNGQDYGGWLNVQITAGIERQCRDFSLGITRQWPGTQELQRQVQAYDLCEVLIGGDKILTGYIDSTPISYDADSVTVSIKGRGKTADLVDCSAKHLSGQWRNRKVEDIAADLAAVYGLKVITQVNTGAAVIEHQIEPGESAFECLDRLLTARQLLSTDDADGNLVLVESASGGRAATSLEYGQNIYTAETSLDYKDVYSEYKCVGQRSGNDFDSGTTVTTINASAEDKTVPRYRLLLIQQSGQVTTQDSTDRVKYERLFRSAKAVETTYVVQGWRQGNGDLWLPNQLVKVIDPIIGFNSELLISEVTYSYGEDGTTTTLKVLPAAAYAATKLRKTKAAKKAKGAGASWDDVSAADEDED